jgi:putative flippase GtrA
MSTDITNESGRRAFYRFGLSGVVFTILGPTLFWLAYPLGPFVAVAMAELLTHALRFITFRRFVFPAKKGYQVSLRRYVVSALPTSLFGLVTVILLRNILDRTMLTLSGTVVAVVVGFVWSRFIYKQPLVKR